MKKSILLSIICISLSPFIAYTKGAPLVGATKATAYQKCGKDIILQIGRTKNGHVVLGLSNKMTKALDLFVSSSQINFNNSYSQFKSVKFDALSKSLIETNDDEIDIVWGMSKGNDSKTYYRLALGNHTYECTAIVKWPNDKANELYGEHSGSIESISDNKAVGNTEQKNLKPAVSDEQAHNNVRENSIHINKSY